MKYIYIGKISNTHGIKGEIKIKSDFLRKDLIFNKGFKLYIGPDKCCETINTYRVHQEYDMVTFDGITNINDVLKYKGMNVFINRDDLKLDTSEYLIEDLIGFKVIENKKELGIVKDFVYNSTNILLIVSSKKEFYIPYNSRYIESVSLEKKEIYTCDAGSLIL